MISLDLPENQEKEKSEKEKSGKGDRDTTKDQGEKDDMAKDTASVEEDPEIQALKMKRQESLKAYYSQAAALQEKGIAFGVSLIEVDGKDVFDNLRIMHKHGLSSDAALAALTTYPASLLGVEAFAGTVEKGKMANLAVFTGPFLEKDSELRHVFVNGNKHTYEGKAKGKGGSAKDAAEVIFGTWTYRIETPGGIYSGQMRFTKSDETIKGEISSDQEGGGEFTEFENLVAKGKTVTCDMVTEVQGQRVKLSYVLDFEDDDLSGSVNVGQFGDYEVEGSRVPEK